MECNALVDPLTHYFFFLRSCPWLHKSKWYVWITTIHTPPLYVFRPKHTRLITLMHRKSHSVTIPFAQSLLITSPRKAVSNPGRKYEVPLKQDKVLTRTKGPSVSTGYFLLLGKWRHLVASRSWRLTDHPPTRFPILHGSLSAGPPLVLSRVPLSAVKEIPFWGVH